MTTSQKDIAALQQHVARLRRITVADLASARSLTRRVSRARFRVPSPVAAAVLLAASVVITLAAALSPEGATSWEPAGLGAATLFASLVTLTIPTATALGAFMVERNTLAPKSLFSHYLEASKSRSTTIHCLSQAAALLIGSFASRHYTDSTELKFCWTLLHLLWGLHNLCAVGRLLVRSLNLFTPQGQKRELEVLLTRRLLPGEVERAFLNSRLADVLGEVVARAERIAARRCWAQQGKFQFSTKSHRPLDEVHSFLPADTGGTLVDVRPRHLARALEFAARTLTLPGNQQYRDITLETGMLPPRLGSSFHRNSVGLDMGGEGGLGPLAAAHLCAPWLLSRDSLGVREFFDEIIAMLESSADRNALEFERMWEETRELLKLVSSSDSGHSEPWFSHSVDSLIIATLASLVQRVTRVATRTLSRDHIRLRHFAESWATLSLDFVLVRSPACVHWCLNALVVIYVHARGRHELREDGASSVARTDADIGLQAAVAVVTGMNLIALGLRAQLRRADEEVEHRVRGAQLQHLMTTKTLMLASLDAPNIKSLEALIDAFLSWPDKALDSVRHSDQVPASSQLFETWDRIRITCGLLAAGVAADLGQDAPGHPSTTETSCSPCSRRLFLAKSLLGKLSISEGDVGTDGSALSGDVLLSHLLNLYRRTDRVELPFELEPWQLLDGVRPHSPKPLYAFEVGTDDTESVVKRGLAFLWTDADTESLHVESVVQEFVARNYPGAEAVRIPYALLELLEGLATVVEPHEDSPFATADSLLRAAREEAMQRGALDPERVLAVKEQVLDATQPLPDDLGGGRYFPVSEIAVDRRSIGGDEEAEELQIQYPRSALVEGSEVGGHVSRGVLLQRVAGLIVRSISESFRDSPMQEIASLSAIGEGSLAGFGYALVPRTIGRYNQVMHRLLGIGVRAFLYDGNEVVLFRDGCVTDATLTVDPEVTVEDTNSNLVTFRLRSRFDADVDASLSAKVRIAG